MGVVCPNCSVMNAPGALFCEACGYDYTTGTMPRPPEPSILDLDAPLPEDVAPEAVAGGAATDSPAPLPPAPSVPASPTAGPEQGPATARAAA
ncbi:MAG: hypothetical protein Q4F67_16905, partial [Propionibacteriaceae bacterium]|nr:hypothetical protein [Propionibacteriaceae bacterium]